MTRFNDLLSMSACALLAGGCFSPQSATVNTGGAGADASESGDAGSSADGGSGTGGGPASDDGSMSSMDGGTGNSSGDGDTDDPTGQSGSTDSGPVTCDPGFACVAEAPAGWTGPAAVYSGSARPPECPAGLPTAKVEAGAMLSASPATCSCSCGQATGFECTVNVTEAGNQCGDFTHNPTTWNIGDGCQTISTADSAMTASGEALDVSGASCSPISSEVVPPAQWGVNVRACEADSADACDGGTCLRDVSNDFGLTCIYADGDLECPAGPYTERQLHHRSWTDTRACSACTCGTPTGSCNGDVTYATGCVGLQGTYGTFGVTGCNTLSGDPGAIIYDPQPSVACQQAGGSAVGQAAPTDAVTLCCLP